MERHHVLFSRKMWSSVSKEARTLRQTHSLIPQIGHDEHVALHQRVPIVPLPDKTMLQEIAHRYQPADTFARSLDNLLLTITEVSVLPKMTNIEQRLGSLVIYALEEQRPFLKDVYEREN